MTEIAGLFGSNWPEPDDVLLLRALLHTDLAVARRTWNEFAPRWNPAVPTAEQYRLFPLLSERLPRLAPSDPRLGMLHGVRRQTAITMMLLLDRLDRALATLETVGIEPVVLKGAGLCLDVYDNVAQRPSGDLDLAVGPRRYEDARAALLRAGWTQKTDDFRGNHAVSFELDGQDLDLHRQVNRELVVPGKPDAAWGMFEVVPAAKRLASGRPVMVLGHTDNLLHAIVHGMHRGRPANLRWAADATRLLQTGPIDWPRFIRLTKLFGLASVMHSGLTFVADVSGVEVPPTVLADLAAIRLSRLQRAQVWAFHVWGPIDGPLRGLPRTCSRLLERTRDRTVWGIIAASPAYFAEVWGASSVWRLPGAVLRKLRRVRSTA